MGAFSSTGLGSLGFFSHDLQRMMQMHSLVNGAPVDWVAPAPWAGTVPNTLEHPKVRVRVAQRTPRGCYLSFASSNRGLRG